MGTFSFILFFKIIFSYPVYAQTEPKCEVLFPSLNISYTGECKKGLANGSGEAKGVLYLYKGAFKKGYPEGLGEMQYGNNTFFIGNFQKGIKEGKGEFHMVQEGKADSILRGFWSGDVYRGNTYKTHNYMCNKMYDRKEIRPSASAGNSITIEASKTKGPLLIDNVVCTSGRTLRKIVDYSTMQKHSLTFEITEFPVSLQIMVSDGGIINLDLYKSADWFCTLYLNR